jgi:Fe-S-cluster containining protein
MSNKTVSNIKVGGANAKVLTGLDPFHLSCGITGCSANCCTKSAPIVLNPYEIALICREINTHYEDLLDIVETGRVKGFPLIMLPRDPACRFWTGRGCSIYRARPLACRLYPLGRIFDHGRSHIVMPELNICSGLSSDPEKTVAEFLREQDTENLIKMADHWIEFVSALERLPLPDKPVTSIAFHMLVYSPDTPTSPGAGHPDLKILIEENFILKLATARKKLPAFLRIS